jgi:hypothetical protein
LSYADLFLRASMDILFVILGVYIYEKMVRTHAINYNQEYST